MSSLASKALLANIKIGSWTGQKLDKIRTEETAAQNEASKEAGKYTKNLFGKSFLKQISSINNAVRALHQELTLPWNNTQRLLPISIYEEYKHRMEELQNQAAKAKNDLKKKYADAIEEAKNRMGRIFNPEDYPPVDELLKKFYINIEYDQIPEIKHFIADVGEEEKENITKQIQNNTEAKIKGTVQDLYARFKDIIDLTKKNMENGAFSNPLMQNIDELVNLIPNLNITGDTEILAMTSELQNSLADVDAEELRPKKEKKFNKEAHDKVVETVEDLSTRLAGFFG